MLAAAVALPLLAQGCVNSYGPGRHLIELPDYNDRQFLLLVPSDLPVGVKVPLVMDYHGWSESPYYQDELVGMGETVEKYKWLAMIPFGTGLINRKGQGGCCANSVSPEDCEKGTTLDKGLGACGWNAGSCCPAASVLGTNDVEFTEVMLDWALANMCADSRYFFATGFSNGGMMTNRAGCELAHRFAGLAPVAGNLMEGGGFTCNPSEGVSWVSVCGDRDDVCIDGFEPTAKKWKEFNQCTDGPTATFESGTTKCLEYTGCRGGAFVEYCTVAGLDHEWSGHMRPDGTSPSQNPANLDATAYIFDRFSAIVSATPRRPFNRTA